MHASQSDRPAPGVARRVLAGLLTLIGTIVWTHALAGPLRAAAGIAEHAFAPASLAMTAAALITGMAGTLGSSSRRRAAMFALAAGAASVVVIGLVQRNALVPSLALLPAGVVFAVLGAWLARRLPASLDSQPRRRPVLTFAWMLIALVAVVQVGRLATYVTNKDSDWFLSTRHPFYAKHECAVAYIYGAELNRNGETNVYDPAHYPGLNPDATPHTEMTGMTPEDPYQYPPQFLLLPRLAIGATHDYGAVRSLWFGLNLTLCAAAMLALSAWVGGPLGLTTGLLSPVVLASFPALHNFQYGQFHFAAIALAILALVAFERRRAALGGTLLAASVLAKLFPGVFLIPLIVTRRWRELAWTAGAAIAITAVAVAVLGPSPFVAFVDYHVPRLGDGSAFAFGDAWPEVATLVTAGNQGIQGMVDKLAAMGVAHAGASAARVAGIAYMIVLIVLAILVGRRSAGMSRHERGFAWLGLVGMASLASSGAWADYVPLTCVWLLTMLVPLAKGRPLAQFAIAVCAVLQVFLVGTMPIGEYFNATWMIPLSLVSALAMLIAFAAALVTAQRVPATRSG